MGTGLERRPSPEAVDDHVDERAGRRFSRHNAILAVILVLAAAVRFDHFPQVPNGLSQDEASAGYETVSLLAAGTDRWGTRWPVYFTSFGSGQNVLQSYLNMPFVAVFGPTVLGIRLLPALLGVLTVGMLYLLTTRVAGRRAGLIAAALLALSPWHVMMSRWSLESNMLPAFMLIAVWALVAAYQSAERRRWLLPLSLAPMALTFYAYAAATFVVLLFVAAFLASEFRTVRRRPVAVTASIGLFGLLALPYALFLLVNRVLHEVPGWLSWLPFGLQVLPGNRLDEIQDGPLLENNYRLLLNGFDDGRVWNVLHPYLPLGLIVLPLAVVGVYFALRDRGSRMPVIVLWVAAAVPMFWFIPLNVNRLNVVFLPLIILSGIGLDRIAASMSPARAGTAVVSILMSLALLYNVAFVYDYFHSYNALIRIPFSEGIDRALTVAESRRAPDEPVYVSDGVPMNYMYVLFFRDVDPRDFRANADYDIEDTFYVVHRYREFYFVSGDPALAAAPSYLALYRGSQRAVCANGASARLLAREGTFRVVRCARRP
jgi:4-amino-4-deoxy-L-arabinose transferase-like glycosyltransferase